ncbi:hypothetical protein FHS78_002083 [Parvibaculum indicum]|uniref:GIY-YIG nuclease family protein n=1 Tax=Parvibaculum indicum TaxID=562969 RepID=UPI001420C960|nr:GIY-YIG nuclease family protein [Parvibaculum indicum]NIJ41793.1 hypothetical protein [Parvibaculum indicum]
MKKIIEEVPKVWIRAFWGFGPWEDGYVGWTREGDRKRVLDEAQSGDLVLIYGATSAETEISQQGQVLGVLEIDPIPIMDHEKSSTEGMRRKRESGWGHRWTYGLPVRRAWRVTRQIEIQNLASTTYTTNRARVIASQGAKLTEEEVQRVLRLPVKAVNVYGEPEVAITDEEEVPLKEVFFPSRGVEPSFGSRNSEYEDGQHWLYMMELKGDVSTFLGRPSYEVGKGVIVKVGFSNDPMRRCAEMNAGFPPASKYEWKISLNSAAYASGQAAKDAEDILKEKFARRFEPLGKEFFLGESDALKAEFSGVPGAANFFIVGGINKSKS